MSCWVFLLCRGWCVLRSAGADFFCDWLSFAVDGCCSDGLTMAVAIGWWLTGAVVDRRLPSVFPHHGQLSLVGCLLLFFVYASSEKVWFCPGTGLIFIVEAVGKGAGSDFGWRLLG